MRTRGPRGVLPRLRHHERGAPLPLRPPAAGRSALPSRRVPPVCAGEGAAVQAARRGCHAAVPL